MIPGSAGSPVPPALNRQLSSCAVRSSAICFAPNAVLMGRLVGEIGDMGEATSGSRRPTTCPSRRLVAILLCGTSGGEQYATVASGAI